MTDAAAKLYKKSPLAFQGQKSKWFKKYKQTLEQVAEYANATSSHVLVVDVFGGSGLLSHIAKRLFPSFDVIYNDFDNFQDRLTHIHDVNVLMEELRALFPGRKANDQTKLTPEEADTLRNFLNSYTHPIDAFSLSSWIQFSGTEYRTLPELLKLKHYYLRFPQNTYNEEEANHYLDNIIVIHEDASNYDKFQTILQDVKQKNNISDDHLLTFYVLDPPYLY